MNIKIPSTIKNEPLYILTWRNNSFWDSFCDGPYYKDEIPFIKQDMENLKELGFNFGYKIEQTRPQPKEYDLRIIPDSEDDRNMLFMHYGVF